MKIFVDEGAYYPQRTPYTDAGLELRTPVTFSIPAGGSYTVDTGVHVDLPPYTVGFIKSEPSLNINYNIITEGVIDWGYTDSIRVKLYNSGLSDVVFSRGNKIAQLFILPVCVPVLEEGRFC